ncbi:MAG TPA: 4-(cytidine 5'-diphospho)-2-C-methyl-D-erythritol kinase [Thermoanaerobaculia bacterium]|jgi:4-diphosphocytidyl-2-C-methyl-D-erythritol kinase|nr:4-(cytidine 5'-diphospho)-2-C-methyl-D-erythritol kinase [Thermoanaerobaculia bacterium]
MRVNAHAKINWSLRITGKRADGFHDLETIFQTISLHDTLTFEDSDHLTLTCNDPTIPVDERNLVVRAAGDAKIAITLHKEIPAGGGLGGGSSDAAATLIALGNASPELALSLGSDVPFFLTGGTAYATGRGEIITPLPRVTGIPLLLLMPEERVSTARAFGMLRAFSPPLGIDRYRAMIDDDLLSHTMELLNDFEEPIFAMLPALRTLKTELYEAGAAWAAMSGSGSTIVGAFRNAEDRDAAREHFKNIRAVAAETT